MSTASAEHHQPTHSQNTALQRLAATREDVILLSHLLQASLVVERSNPLRRVVATHPDLARSVMIVLVIVLSIAIGLVAPSIANALGI
jgi:hypothetical protein